MSERGLPEEIRDLADEILERVSSAGGSATAWDLKMTLKTTHTRLHLALGALLERGAIRMTPADRTHRIETVSADETRTDRAPTEAVG